MDAILAKVHEDFSGQIEKYFKESDHIIMVSSTYFPIALLF